jgi:hypothetical protein
MHAPFVFPSIQAYRPVEITVLFYLEFMGMCLSPTLQWMPHLSCCYKPSPLPAYWGMCATPAFSRWLFYSSHGEVPLLPSPVELSTWQPLLQAFPTPRLVGGGCHSCLFWVVYS